LYASPVLILSQEPTGFSQATIDSSRSGITEDFKVLDLVCLLENNFFLKVNSEKMNSEKIFFDV
jgi:hypothetical protein